MKVHKYTCRYRGCGEVKHCHVGMGAWGFSVGGGLDDGMWTVFVRVHGCGLVLVCREDTDGEVLRHGKRVDTQQI